MIPEGLARIISLQYLLLACLLGGLLGTIFCLALRLRWKALLFGQDMVITGMTTTLLLVTISWAEWRQGTLNSSTNVWFFVVIGSVAPLVHHLVRFILLRNRHER
jgi:hypothetical protein